MHVPAADCGGTDEAPVQLRARVLQQFQSTQAASPEPVAASPEPAAACRTPSASGASQADPILSAV